MSAVDLPVPEVRFGDVEDASRSAAVLARANARLAREPAIPADIVQLVRELNRGVAEADIGRWADVDPYQASLFHKGLSEAVEAVWQEEPSQARDAMRLALERMRHALSEIASTEPVADDRSARDIVAWLVRTVEIPQGEMARLLGVERRKLGRWLNEGVEPSGDDDFRIRAVARIINQLRHTLTPVGAVRWFDRSRRQLGGRPPIELLSHPEYLPELMQLAASARASGAS
jgi:hypothetical protein